MAAFVNWNLDFKFLSQLKLLDIFSLHDTIPEPPRDIDKPPSLEQPFLWQPIFVRQGKQE